MSKEEILKIQACVLKVNIDCDGCENKVRKILQNIEGVYKTSINSEQGKVTVLGNADPATLIKKLRKKGKHAELWGTPKSNTTTNNNNNFKIDSGKGANNKNQKGNNSINNNNNQQKGGQNLAKGFQDLKLPQFNGLNLPFRKDQNKKVRFMDDDDMSDDDYEDYDYEEELDDGNYLDDFVGDAPHHGKGMGNGQIHNMMMNGQAKGGGGGNNGGNVKKGGGGNVQAKGNDGKNGSNGKKGGGGGNIAHNQAGGGKGGGGKPFDGKNGGGSLNNNGNAGKNVGGMNNGVQGMPNMSNVYHGMGQVGNNKPMGQMGNFPMSQIPAVAGLPAGTMGEGGGGGGGYYGGGVPEVMAGNPYYQQQLAAAMMNQQRAQGNERFQPMMYARPPSAVNYMQPYSAYPYPPPTDLYTHAFSDENTWSCSVM